MTTPPNEPDEQGDSDRRERDQPPTYEPPPSSGWSASSGQLSSYGQQPPSGGQPPPEEPPAYGQQPGYGPPPGYGQQPAYGQPAYGQPPVGQRGTEPKAIIGLVCSVLGICLCGIILGAVGAVLGFLARRDIAASGGAKTGDGMALAAIIVGALAVVLNIALLLFWLVAGGSGNIFFPRPGMDGPYSP